MKKSSVLLSLMAGGFFLALIVSGCTLNNVSGEQDQSLTEADLQAASGIIGESLSDDNSGLMLSLKDALTTVSSSGFGTTTSAKSTTPTLQEGDDPNGRGGERDFKYSYNPETGVHTVSFLRMVDRPLFSKEVTDTLKYIFTDMQGDFIQYPRQQRDRIESIDFTGHREGTVSTLRKESFFVRKDTFLIDGVSSNSPVLSIEGKHTGQGTIKIDRANGDRVTRSYQLEVNLLNIEIDKALAGDSQNLEQGVTGMLNWTLIIDKDLNGSTSNKTIRGTVELNGDGTALLRFKNVLKRFFINLDDGDYKDAEKEFEGRVSSVDPTGLNVTLVSGRTLSLTDSTTIDEEDYLTLEEVQNALLDGAEIWTEGEGFVRNGQFIVSEIEFKSEGEEESEDPNQDKVDFEAFVTSADAGAGTFTMGSERQVTVQVNNETEIVESGDFLTLEEVAEALAAGTAVEADGDAIQASSGSADLTALKVEFKNESEED